MPKPGPFPARAALALLLLALPGLALAEPLPRPAAEAAFQQAVREARAAREAVQALQEAGAAAADPMAEAAARRSREAEAFAAETRAALGEALAAEYRQRYLRLSTRPGERWAAGEPALCVDLANTGPLAVRAVGLGLRLRGAPLGGEGTTEMFRPEDRTTDILRLAGPKEDGLPPWRSWRQPEASCARLEPAPAPESAAAGLLRRLGGFSREARDWQFVLTEVTLVRVQEALGARGFRVGTPDGVPGPRTVAAVQAFQESRGEAATGVLTETQLGALLGAAR
ncbi:peptidoglycan-binding domain-containing protein [Roseicella frigidaeris]|uniref:Peptidoglycan binding-like domain-containing protein n=1 Tax=Roseicella frigidaeris TaxID=2230885 RepID=A0A327MDI8_9PROT|nr:peptidoglycan-binding domain-containing protein [Roseicella frigidaeris]RAI60737.1 hypothetical protein DOO78_00980 [Roseicella frigidaeris]